MPYPFKSKPRKDQNRFPPNPQLPQQVEPLSSQQNSFLLLLAGVIAIGVIAVLGLTIADWLTPPIVFIQTNDESASAKEFGNLPQLLCRTAAQKLKYRDTVLWLSFADRTELTNTQTISSNFALLGQCQEVGKAVPSSIGKRPGTSLMGLVDRLPRVIASQRNQGNTSPVVVSILLHEIEPGSGQPITDWAYIQEQISKLTSDRAILVISGPKGQLQEDLETHLGNVPHVRLCPSANASTCLETAINIARQL